MPRNIAIILKFDKTGTADYTALIGRKLILSAKGDCWFGLNDEVIDGGFLTGLKEDGGTDTALPLIRVIKAEFIGYFDGTYFRWLLTSWELQEDWIQEQSVTPPAPAYNTGFIAPLPIADIDTFLPFDGYYMFYCSMQVSCSFPHVPPVPGWHFADVSITITDADGISTVRHTDKGRCYLYRFRRVRFREHILLTN